MTRHRIMIEKWKYDEVGKDVGPKKDKSKENEISAPLEHLTELKNSDYKLVSRETDVYGWKVVDLPGQPDGIVKDFLFDEDEKKIRYLVVNLKETKTKKEDKDILIPIGRAEIDRERRVVVVAKELTSEELAQIPPYRNVRSLAIEDEKKTLLSFSNTAVSEIDYTRDNFYRREEFNEEVFFGPGGSTEK